MDNEGNSNSSPSVDQLMPELAQRPQSTTVPDGVTAAASPVVVFQGLTSADGAGLSTAVSGTVHNGADADSGVRGSVCLDIESIYKAMDTSQSVSAGIPCFRVREKTEFVNSLKHSTCGITILIYAYSVKGVNTAIDYQLKNEIAAPVDDNATRKFVQSYGDSFVSSQTLGSEYYAALTFHYRTSEERETTKKSLKMHGIAEVFSFGASFQKTVDDLKATANVEVTFERRVRGIANPTVPSFENMIKYALDFSKIPANSPVIISYGFTGYEHLPGVNNFQKVAENRKTVEGLLKNLDELNQINCAIENLQTFYKFYKFTKDTQLNAQQAKVKKNTDAVNGQINAYLKDPLAKIISPPLDGLQLGSPVLKHSGVVKPPGYGGNGGTAFEDFNIDVYLQCKYPIQSVILNTGTYQHGKKAIKKRRDYHTTVYQLTVGYTSTDGSIRTVSHGSGGSPSHSLDLSNQFVTKIEGCSDDEVEHLKVTASNNNSIEGGGKEGKHFEFPIPPDSVLIGFTGRSGGRLVNVGVVYVTLYPATWVK